MCTVTFLPVGNTIYLTSNRDEAVTRKTAGIPQIVPFSSGNMLFPKDSQAGGTWVATHENGNAMVLLNGAFIKHHHNPPYRKSRGVIFLEVFNHNSPTEAFKHIDLIGIEPFTLVIWQGKQLWECRWDQTTKHITQKPANEPQIWSSATLYDEPVRTKREIWFYLWLNQHTTITAEGIREFHEFGGEGDSAIDLRMNRNGMLLTVSTTGIAINNTKATMHYKDIQNDVTTVAELHLNNVN